MTPRLPLPLLLLAVPTFVLPLGAQTPTADDAVALVREAVAYTRAHGQEPVKVGVEALHSKDPDGRPFIQERIQVARAKGRGWQDIKHRDPRTGHAAPKAMYSELHDGLIFDVGVYKS